MMDDQSLDTDLGLAAERRAVSDGLLPRWLAKVINAACVFAGLWLSTGRFWPAFWIAAITTPLSAVGIGWQALQFLSIASLTYGVLRIFGALPF